MDILRISFLGRVEEGGGQPPLSQNVFFFVCLFFVCMNINLSQCDYTHPPPPTRVCSPFFLCHLMKEEIETKHFEHIGSGGRTALAESHSSPKTGRGVVVRFISPQPCHGFYRCDGVLRFYFADRK